MKILITGAAGFIGSNFVRMVAGQNFPGVSQVIALDKLTYAGNLQNLNGIAESHNFHFVHGDICDSELVKALTSQVDAIINFAAESHVDRSILGASDFVKSNIVGVQILLDGIRATGRKVRFLQVSTDEVYGSIEFGSWSEESPILPNSPYSASKASGELLARSYHRTHGTDIVITRCSNNYGTGMNVRDWLHVDDHCRGIYSVLMNGRSGEVYNIGGGRELSNNEITSLILEAMGADKSSIEFVDDRKGHDLRYSLDWTKINQELGYEPNVKFEDGLKDTIQWYRENEEWWKPLKNT